MSDVMRGAIVGLGMGRNHIAAMEMTEGLEVAAICDVDDSLLSETAATVGGDVATYRDFDTMLANESIDFLTVASPNRFHAPMTRAALTAGISTICCEKPFAVDLGEARELYRLVQERNARLVVNHQRRMGSEYRWMRDQIAAGAIGEPYLIRGTCAGDMASDGTHLIDSILFLVDDPSWSWTFASGFRADYPTMDSAGLRRDTGSGFDKVEGWRFGHPVEDGMFAVVELESRTRVELLTGDLRSPGRPYHDVEVIGTEGALWRSGDQPGPNLYRRSADRWELVENVPNEPATDRIAMSYKRLREIAQEGAPVDDHPLGIGHAMLGFELLMGIYESARIGAMIRPPVSQDRFPLAIELGL